MEFPKYTLRERYKPVGDKGRRDRPDLDDETEDGSRLLVAGKTNKVTPEKRKREDVEDQLDRILVKWGAKSTPYPTSRTAPLDITGVDSDFDGSEVGGPDCDLDGDSDSDSDSLRKDLCQTENLLHLDDEEALGPIYAREHDYPVSEDELSDIDDTEDLLDLKMNHYRPNGRGGTGPRERWNHFTKDAEGELVDGLTGMAIGDRWRAENGDNVAVPVS